MLYNNPLDRAYSWDVNNLFNAFLPVENETQNTTLSEKIKTYSIQALAGLGSLGVGAVLTPFELASTAIEYIGGYGPQESELEKFQNKPHYDHLTIDPTIDWRGGTGSEYQFSGATNCPNSSWASWEKDGLHLPNEKQSGVVLDFWSKPDEVIEKLKHLNIKHFRFSVEWSNIQPTKDGGFDEKALQHYVDLVLKLKKEGIEPFITLHHFSDAKWFLDMGGFEKEENIPYFIEFAKKVYATLIPHCKEWVTFNEPTIYAFQGYIRGAYPPGGIREYEKAGYVCKHLMMAHCQAYDELKKINPESKIGIAHQILRFVPYYPNLSTPQRAICYYLSQMTHYCVMNFFAKGEFSYQIPCGANVTYSRPDAQDKLDFFGVQYYTVALISIGGSTCYPNEKMMKMPFRFYPEGMATALDQCRAIKKPIWITETGASALTPEDQKEFYEKVFKVVSLAKKLGVPVERVHVWSPIDNYEWDMNYEQFFGMYGFNHVTKETYLRPAGEFFRELFVKYEQFVKNAILFKQMAKGQLSDEAIHHTLMLYKNVASLS